MTYIKHDRECNIKVLDLTIVGLNCKLFINGGSRCTIFRGATTIRFLLLCLYFCHSFARRYVITTTTVIAKKIAVVIDRTDLKKELNIDTNHIVYLGILNSLKI